MSKCLEANRHNNATTAYYLALKKQTMEGNLSEFIEHSVDKSMPEIKKTKNGNNVIIDSFFTRSS